MTMTDENVTPARVVQPGNSRSQERAEVEIWTHTQLDPAHLGSDAATIASRLGDLLAGGPVFDPTDRYTGAEVREHLGMAADIFDAVNDSFYARLLLKRSGGPGATMAEPVDVYSPFPLNPAEPRPAAFRGGLWPAGRPNSVVVRHNSWQLLNLTGLPTLEPLLDAMVEARHGLLTLADLPSTQPPPPALLIPPTVETVDAYLVARAAVLKALREQFSTKRSRQRISTPEPLGPDYIRFHSDNVQAATFQGLGRVNEWSEGVGGFYLGLRIEGKDFQQTIGFFRNPGAKVAELLRDRGPAAIKAHYTLWARCYEETGGDPNKWVTLSVVQFCDDLGYRRHKGGHKLSNKQAAMDLLDGLTTAELSVIDRGHRLQGAIWQRGLVALSQDQYGDVFGAARAESERAHWEPVTFSYHPGQWFADEEWRKANAAMGLIGIGLLKLDTRRDEWGIRIAGYYGTLARIGAYAQRKLSASMVLERTGLAKVNARHPAEQHERFERAHERLVKVGILKAWQWDTEPVTDEPDMDDPDTYTSLKDYGDGDWRRRRVLLTWPDALSVTENRRLQAARRKAVDSQSRRDRRNRQRVTGG